MGKWHLGGESNTARNAEDDVERHTMAKNAEDDTSGHVRMDDDESEDAVAKPGERVRVRVRNDESDVEGHGLGARNADDDVEGHGLGARNADDEDTEGHNFTR